LKQHKKKKKEPWPTKNAMEQIYDQNLWGGLHRQFYSGEGSYASYIVTPYLDGVIKFMKKLETPITILDLGCGDFNIGKQLLPFSDTYIAVDIAQNVIDFNKKIHTQDNVDFLCLDISKDTLPKADVVIVRQVLQHLSNTEVQRILNKLSVYKYILLTEHLPIGEFIPNKDIISGQGIRIKQHSGLVITESPFNFKYMKQQELVSTKLNNNMGVLKTWLFSTF